MSPGPTRLSPTPPSPERVAALRFPRSRMPSTVILGTGSYAPERVLSNADLTRMVDTSDEWIVSRSGIRERRIAAPGETTSDMGVQAARRALDDAGLKPSDIDLLVVATVTPDVQMPAAACFIQHKLGL